jgi:hypothetical protein
MGGTVDGSSGDHVVLAPPYTIAEGQLDEMVEKLDTALASVLAPSGCSGEAADSKAYSGFGQSPNPLYSKSSYSRVRTDDRIERLHCVGAPRPRAR